MPLNPAQAEAVKTLSGPLLVLAGAGSGKTRVVTQRIAELIRSGIAPERILAVTFTNKAAAEMRDRVSQILARQFHMDHSSEQPEISTFHALCVRILRRHIGNLGYPEMFAIYDRGDQESLAGRVLRESGVNATMRPSDFVNIVSHWKTMGVRDLEADHYAETDREYLAAMFYPRYQTALKAAGAVDFDDILLLTEDLFRDFPDVRQFEQRRFDHILVDEYQDTNKTQYHIVQTLAEEHRNLCVVGDDDQSIYAWRGAEVTHILRFKQDWPEAKVVRLETNYRSTHEIIDWANRVVAFNRVRHPKTLRATRSGEMPRILRFDDGDMEAQEIVTEIRRRIQSHIRRPNEMAVLFRTNEQSRAFEMEFQRQNVPYTLIGGTSFFDRKEVRDLLAYLRVILNPRDEVSLLRLINTPPRGIGQTTVLHCMEYAHKTHTPLWELLGRTDELTGALKLNPKAALAITQFRGLIRQFQGAKRNVGVDVLLNDLIQQIDYRTEINRLHEKDTDREFRWNLVEELVNSAASFMRRENDPRLLNFVQQLSLTDRNDSSSNDKDEKLQQEAVILMTLHAAKGLEFPEVYMVGMEEGLLPHKKSVAENHEDVSEERRLCYVGITRAMERLTLSMAIQRLKWGRMKPTIPSRFLYEMTGKSDNPNYVKICAGIHEGTERS